MLEDLKDYSKDELTGLLASMGEEPYRAGQIFRRLYRETALKIDDMKNLPAPLLRALSGRFRISRPHLLDVKTSRLDGTAKFLLGLEDSSAIETVYIPQGKRATACVSSQVGCKRSCAFCASSAAKFVRNLRTGEIVNEILFVKAKGALPVTNVVFMGIGEPFDNYDNVMKAVRVINDPDGLNIGSRRITISTCGLIPGIERLSGEGLQVELSVSLHSADDAARTRLVSVNKRYPIRDLIDSCREYISRTNRVITFEYVLIKGINSSHGDALKLVKLLKGLKCKVNLIRYNQIKALGYETPSPDEARAFLDALTAKGLNACSRRSRGEDIDAACGQLRIARMGDGEGSS